MTRKLFGRILPGFFVLTVTAGSFAFAINPTPLRISAWPKESSPCKRDATTIGLDLGLWRASTCKVIGAQLAPFAAAGNIYGLQFGLLEAAIKGRVYGIQIGGLTASAGWTDSRYTIYGLQLAGLLNNFSFDQTEIKIAGIQAAGLANMAGYVKGVQISLLNDARTITGAQAGAVNLLGSSYEKFSGPSAQLGLYNQADQINGIQIGAVNIVSHSDANRGAQIGLYNKAEKVTGLQFGIVNSAGKLVGAQIGLINIVSKKYRRLNVPFTPILNVAW